MPVLEPISASTGKQIIRDDVTELRVTVCAGNTIVKLSDSHTGDALLSAQPMVEGFSAPLRCQRVAEPDEVEGSRRR